MASVKIEGPTIRDIFLGIGMDTEDLTLRLSKDKLGAFKEMMREWLPMQKVMHSKRLTVLGKKTTTCMQGSQLWKDTFEKGFQLFKVYARKQSFVCLNAAFRLDLMWWHLFLEMGMMENSVDCSTSINLHTDMLGSLWLWRTECLQLPWWEITEEWSVATKEMVPVVSASVLWDVSWHGSLVVAHCDNLAVNTRYSKDFLLVQLLWCLFSMHSILSH